MTTPTGRPRSATRTAFVPLVSAVTNLMFIAAYPAWSIIVIAIDVLVIYALAMHGDELAEGKSFGRG